MKNNKICKLCGSKNTAKLFRSYNTHGRHEINKKEKFLIYRCKDCGVVFVSDLLINQEYYKKYYELGYYEPSASNSIIGKILERVGALSINRKINIISRQKTSSDKLTILDFGCGSGNFLFDLSDDKFQKFGLEINPDGRKICQKRGIKVFDDIEKFGKKKFDVVTMWHVLEHIDNPNTVLKAISKVLNKKGELIIQTPNTDGIGFRSGRQDWFHLDSPRHLMLYNRAAIKFLAEENGFELTKVINEFYDYPLDLFWSVRRHNLRFLFYILYPFFKYATREHLTYILKKK